METTLAMPLEPAISGSADANDSYSSKEERFMATGNLTRLFFTFSIPGVCGILFISLQTLADGILLGRFAGASHMAAVNVALPAFSVLLAMSLVMAVGCETLVSIAMGRGRRASANNAFTTAACLSAGVSVLWGGILFTFAPAIAALCGADATLQPLCVTYLRTLAPFFPTVSLLFLTDYTLKSLGRPVYAVGVMSGVVVLNVLLDLLFIVALGWGIFGAALATGISYSTGLLFDAVPLCRGRMALSLFRGRFRTHLVGRLLYCGSAEGFSECAVGIAIMAFNITLMRYAGAEGIAAYTILNYMLYVATAIFLGTADGIRPVIGYNFGRRQQPRVRGIVLRGLAAVAVMGAGLAGCLFFGGETALRHFFNPDDAAVATMAAQGSRIFAWGIALQGVNILVIGYFTSIGQARTAAILAVVRSFVLVVAGLAVFPTLWGVDGIWVVLPVAETLTLCVTLPLLWKKALRA